MKSTIVVAIIVQVIMVLLAGVCLMLAVDFANDEWLPNLPGLGWWHATLIALFVRGALLMPSTSKDD